MHINKLLYPVLLLLLTVCVCYGQNNASIKGIVLDASNQSPLVGANIHLQNTLIGSVSDENGRFSIQNLSPGKYFIITSFVGYERFTERINLTEGETKELVVELNKTSQELDQVVVTGTRTERKRDEVPVLISVLENKNFSRTQSNFISEALNFQPGVRVEIDCQTCNFSQVRLNGLQGGYSQILINSRPIFSSLNSLYGLEQIPTNMINKVEVLKGGGSALFGASAVGGTINLITKDPVENYFNIDAGTLFIDGTTLDRNLKVNSSIVNNDLSSGISIFGILRDRSSYDANGDGFSEIPEIQNSSFGLNFYSKLSDYSKIKIDLYTINEKRKGGNKLDLPPHQADQAEDREHTIYGWGFTYDRFLPSLSSSIAAYSSGQYTDRFHYTGIDGIDGYGTTDNTTLVNGVQLNHTADDFITGDYNTLTLGIEFLYDDVTDEIPGYNYFLSQQTKQFSLFAQSDWKLADDLNSVIGLRLDNHNMLDEIVLSPRFNLLYNLTNFLQFRGSFSTGFRAPQAFDADLHIAFAGGGISRIVIDENLQKETSQSLSGSLDFNIYEEHYAFGVTFEGFYTKLFDVFVLEELGPDPDQPQNTIIEKRNGGNAEVYGLNSELRINLDNKLEADFGLTWQKSKYSEPVEWSAEIKGTDEFLRTPDIYGYYSITANNFKPFIFSLSGILTGAMNVPHLAGAPGVENDELVRTRTFIETNIKASYTLQSISLPEETTIYLGILNIFDEYQDDFDRGPYRDSNYIYGPAKPRTLFAGIEFGL